MRLNKFFDMWRGPLAQSVKSVLVYITLIKDQPT